MFRVTACPLDGDPTSLKNGKPAKASLHQEPQLLPRRKRLPKFDELTFLIVPDTRCSAYRARGWNCDVLDPSIRLDGQVGLLQQMQLDGQAKLLTAQTMTMEWLGIGIVPASYDDGYNSTAKQDRPDIFGDKRMRQAIALCLDRQKVVDTVLFGLSQVPDSYLPSDHPLHNGNVQTYEFNPTAGNQDP